MSDLTSQPLRKELFTIPEIAVALSVSERTVESLISQGFLRSGIAPGTGRTRRISRRMLEEYVARFDSSP